jgi:hypothetical protein
MVEGKLFQRLSFKHDLWVLNVAAPIMWVGFAAVAYLAFAQGRIGEGIAHIGMLIVLFCGLIHLWGIVDSSRDIALSKLTTIATLFGVLVCATGWLIRRTT